MTQTNTPIYHQVCEDLNVFPLAQKRRTHEQFMREHEQTEWLYQAQARSYVNPPLVTRLKRPARSPRKRR